MDPQHELTLPDVLDHLNYTPDEFFQLCTEPPGGVFSTSVLSAGRPQFNPLPTTANWWFSVNPTTGPERINAGRGGAADVTRLAGIWVDLDLVSATKLKGCPDLATAMAVIDDLSGLLGSTPVFITHSGHGVQPVWAIEDGDIDYGGIGDGSALPRTQAAAVLRRWGRLVANVADRRGCHVDSLYDLPRVLRAPGSVNVKYRENPVTVRCVAAGGSPISVEHLEAVLLENNIPQVADDGTDPGVVLSAPAEWTLNDHTCKYATSMVTRWATDHPAARHQWLVAQATRLAAAHRNGCLDPTGYQRAEQALVDRFTALVTGAGDRGTTAGEIRGAINFGIERASTMTDIHLAGELGNHLHHNDPGDFPMPRVAMAPRHLEAVPSPPGGESTTATPPPAPSGPATGLPDRPAEVVAGATVTELRPRIVELPGLTDQGNAELFADRHHDHLRYVPSRGSWLAWNGHRWRPCDDDSEAVQAAVETIQSIRPQDEAQRKHKTSSLSAGHLAAAVLLGRKIRTMLAGADDLDSDPYALNTPTGTINLRTGEMTPCDPAAMHTMATGAPFDPSATAPRFERFLSETFTGAPELGAYIQRLAGYSAIGTVTEHALPFLHGSGGNGKTVLLDILQGVLGTYAESAPLGFLLHGGREDESAVARLQGLRLVVASEVNQSAKFDEAKVKMLTGGDRITARHLYSRHFTFAPSHTIWLAGNHQPRVDAGGESFWRRLRLIPFDHTVPRENREPGLAARIIRDEGPGVLNWIIQGALTAGLVGLLDPAKVRDAVAVYATEEDSLGRFIDECCHLATGGHTKTATAAMRAAYEQWCREEGEQPVSPQTFGRELRTRWNVTAVKTNGTRFYVDLTLAGRRDDNDDRVSRVRTGSDEKPLRTLFNT